MYRLNSTHRAEALICTLWEVTTNWLIDNIDVYFTWMLLKCLGRSFCRLASWYVSQNSDWDHKTNTHRNSGPTVLGDSISKTYRSVTITYGDSLGIPGWFSWREVNVFIVLFLADQNHVQPSFNATCSRCKHLHAAVASICTHGRELSQQERYVSSAHTRLR